MHLKIKVFPNPGIDFVKITNTQKGAEFLDLTLVNCYMVTKSTEGSVIIDVSTFKKWNLYPKNTRQTVPN